MIKLQNIHSLTDFLRNTKAHVERIKATKTAEVLTVNGKAELVVQDAESYQAMLDRLEKAETLQAIYEGLTDIAEGHTRAAGQVVAGMRAKYGS